MLPPDLAATVDPGKDRARKFLGSSSRDSGRPTHCYRSSDIRIIACTARTASVVLTLTSSRITQVGCVVLEASLP